MVKVPPDFTEKDLSTFSVALFAGVAAIALKSTTNRKRILCIPYSGKIFMKSSQFNRLWESLLFCSLRNAIKVISNH
jgi:hypothetical protein